MRRLLCVAILASTTLASACQYTMKADPKPVPGFVSDLSAFKAFIATHPTPERFRKTYPDVLLVLPGQIATRELRMNNSRYFAELDGEGRVTGGKFM